MGTKVLEIFKNLGSKKFVVVAAVLWVVSNIWTGVSGLDATDPLSPDIIKFAGIVVLGICGMAGLYYLGQGYADGQSKKYSDETKLVVGVVPGPGPAATNEQLSS